MPRRNDNQPLLGDYELVSYASPPKQAPRKKRRAPKPPRQPVELMSRPRPQVEHSVKGYLLPPPPRYPINRWVQV